MCGISLSFTSSSLPVPSVAYQSFSGDPFGSFPTSSLHSFAEGGKEKQEREREGGGRKGRETGEGRGEGAMWK